MIAAVLNFLGVPNEEGFFAKDLDAKQYLTEGWQARAYEHFKAEYPEAAAAVLHQSPRLGTGRGTAGLSSAQRLMSECRIFVDSALARIVRGANGRRTRSRARRSARAQGRPRRNSARTWASSRPKSAPARGKFINAAKQALESRVRWTQVRLRTRGSGETPRFRMDRSHRSRARRRARQPASDHADPVGDRRPLPLPRFHRPRWPGSRNRISTTSMR